MTLRARLMLLLCLLRHPWRPRSYVAQPEAWWYQTEAWHVDGRHRVIIHPVDVFIVACSRCGRVHETWETDRQDRALVVHPDGSTNPLEDE